jgi:hypothetical protein
VVRVYIDRLDQTDGAVWAVDCAPAYLLPRQYLRAHRVVVDGPAVVSVFRPGPRQPKAWLATGGRVMRATTPDGVVEVTIT